MSLEDSSAKLENMYTSPKNIRGDESKLLNLPLDVKNMVNKGFFALAFFVAILSGVGIGMGMFLKYKLCILLLIIFILIVIVSPEISDYIVYGIAEYTDLGYTGLKRVTNNIFINLESKNNNNYSSTHPPSSST